MNYVAFSFQYILCCSSTLVMYSRCMGKVVWIFAQTFPFVLLRFKVFRSVLPKLSFSWFVCRPCKASVAGDHPTRAFPVRWLPQYSPRSPGQNFHLFLRCGFQTSLCSQLKLCCAVIACFVRFFMRCNIISYLLPGCVITEIGRCSPYWVFSLLVHSNMRVSSSVVF